MAPFQITLRASAGARETYTHAALSATHHTDALRRLCRAMVSAGLRGPAEVRGEYGNLRLTVAAVEEAARWSLTENDPGLRIVPYRPFDAAKVRGRQAHLLPNMMAVVAAMRLPAPAVEIIKTR